MATVTKPIALDESLHTTELTPRNLADVLAQALQALNTTISGLNFINAVVVAELPTTGISTTTIYLVPSDDPQSENVYDEYINLDGTSAGWEKIGSTEIDLSNYYTKTETDTLLSGKVDKEVGKGLSTNDYTTAEKTKLAGIEAGAEVNPTSGVKTATESFETVDGGLLSKCMIDLVPVQDLHGYDSPWVGGGGKNKCPVEKLADENSNNFTLSAGSYTFSFRLLGSARYSTSSVILYDSSNNNICAVRIYGVSVNSYMDAQFTLSESKTLHIANSNVIVGSGGYSIDNVQIENGGSRTTFAPYSNICPISGHTEVDLQVDGKNLCSGIENGTWTSSTQSKTNTTIRARVENIVSVKPSTSYTINAKALSGKTIQFITQYYSGLGSGTFVSESSWSAIPFTFTTPSNCKYLVFIFRTSANDDNPESYVEEVQLELGSTATSYEPYNPNSKLYTVQIGSTVYGGYVDLVSGVMKVIYALTDFDSFTWTYDNDYSIWISNSGLALAKDNTPLICEQVKYNLIKTFDAPNMGTKINSTYNVWVRNGSNVTQPSGKGLYELATPQTIQLTPQQIETLSGQNNLSCPLSGQSIETNGVEYKELFTFADVKEYVKPLIPYSNAGSHNAIYRGKYLGSSVTADQWSAIQNGTFDDLFIGDYWTINSVNWRIAHFDYWLGTGDSNYNTHHVVIVPDGKLYDAKINTNNDTTGGYYGSEMRGGANYLVSGSSNLYQASEDAKSAFGSSHIFTHRECLSNAVSSGNASGWAWYDSSIDLMSEVMVYGSLAWAIGGKGFEVASSKEQFALFRYDASKISNRENWWLRSVTSSTGFARVSVYGRADNAYTSDSHGVRPCFAIK